MSSKNSDTDRANLSYTLAKGKYFAGLCPIESCEFKPEP